MLSEGGDDRSGASPAADAALRSRLSTSTRGRPLLTPSPSSVRRPTSTYSRPWRAATSSRLAQATGAGIVAVDRRRAGTGGAVLPSAPASGVTDLSAVDRRVGRAGRVHVGGEYRPPLDALAVHLCAAARPRPAPGRWTRPVGPWLGPNDSRLRRGGGPPRAGEPPSRSARPPCPRRRRAVLATADVQRRPATSARRSTPTRAATCSRRGGARGSPRRGGTGLRGGGLRVGRDAHRPGRPLDRAAPTGDRRLPRARRSDALDGSPPWRCSPGRARWRARSLLRQRRRGQPVGAGRRRRRPALAGPESVAFSLECLRTVSRPAPRATNGLRCAPRSSATRRRRTPSTWCCRLATSRSTRRSPRATWSPSTGWSQSSTASPTRSSSPTHGPTASCSAPCERSIEATSWTLVGTWRRPMPSADRIRLVNIAQFCTAQRFTIARLDGEWGDLPERFAEFVGPRAPDPRGGCMSAQLAAETGDGDGAPAGLEAMADAGYRSVSTDVHFLFSLCCLAEAAVILGERAPRGRAARPPRPPRGDRRAQHHRPPRDGDAHLRRPGPHHRGRRARPPAPRGGAGAPCRARRGGLGPGQPAAPGPGHRGRGERRATGRVARDLLDLVARDAEAKGLTRLARQARDLSGRGDADRPDPLASLTGREREVVALIAEGRSNLDISREPSSR